MDTAATSAPVTTRFLMKFIVLSIIAAALTVAIKGSAAAVTGSVSLLSDALESTVNLVAALVALWARALRPGGTLHLATDWEDYALGMLEVTGAEPRLVSPAGPGRFAEGPGDRPVTRFERRGRRLGHGVWDLVLVRRGDQGSPASGAA